MTSFPRPWRCLASQPVLKNRWLTVRKDTVALPQGITLDDYFVVELSDVALVVPVTPENEVILVRQYRHAVGQVLLELPAGLFDAHQETGEMAARRELREETGYAATTLEPLGVFYDNPVKCAYRVHAYLARAVVFQDAPCWDATEEIDMVKFSLEDIPQIIAAGQITVSASIAALYRGLQQLRSPSVET